jgi:lysophospholipase L1-like esterase
MKQIIAILFFACGLASAQVNPPTIWSSSRTAPSGNCPAGRGIVTIPGGVLYTCQGGTWTQISGGGGSALAPFTTDGTNVTLPSGTLSVGPTLLNSTGIVSPATTMVYAPALGTSELAGDTSYLGGVIGVYRTFAAPIAFNVISAYLGSSSATSAVEYKVFLRSAATAFDTSAVTPDDAGTIAQSTFSCIGTALCTFPLNKTLTTTAGQTVFLFLRVVDGSNVRARYFANNVANSARKGLAFKVAAGWGTFSIGSCVATTSYCESDLELFLQQVPITGATIYSSLPPTTYAVEGRELGIYFEDFLRSDLPLSNYTFDVVCTKGEHDDIRWFYTPIAADAGTLPWSINVYYAGVLVKTFSTSITIVALTAGNGVTRKVVTIGDSTTSGGEWLAEEQNLFSADVMAITQVGSITSVTNDSGATPRTTKHDAKTGWTLALFYTDATSPFVFTGAFNFATYLTTNSITLAANDWVRIHLGINDIFSATDDVTLQTTMEAARITLAAMITNIKAAVSGIRVGIMVTIPPSHSQDAMGTNYGAGQTLVRYQRNRAKWCESLVAWYGAGQVANVYLIPTNLTLDTYHNMQTGTTAYNARNVVTYAKQVNGVHPASSGYWQMADTVFAFLKGLQ